MNNRRGGKCHASNDGRIPLDGTDSLPVKVAPKVATKVYLDMPDNFEADPELMLIWLDQMREHCIMTYESNISDIFRTDGVIGNYPKLENPAPPREDSEKRGTLDNDRVRFMAYLSGQMSEMSKYSVSWTMLGARAVKENNPRDLISAVIITHTSGRRGIDLLCIVKAEKAFWLHAMQPGETLAHHYSRFRLLFSALKLEHLNANVPMREYSELHLSMHFLCGLNSDYADYVRPMKVGLRRWPFTPDDAYAEAARCVPSRGDAEQYGPNARGRNTPTRGGRGGGRTGQQGEGRSGQQRASSASSFYENRPAAAATRYGSRPGQCHACGVEGHHSFECDRK